MVSYRSQSTEGKHTSAGSWKGFNWFLLAGIPTFKNKKLIKHAHVWCKKDTIAHRISHQIKSLLRDA